MFLFFNFQIEKWKLKTKNQKNITEKYWIKPGKKKKNLEVTKVYEFPALETGSDSKVHIFDRGPVLPSTGFVDCSDSPYTGGPCNYISL